jgi:hypothetical protein
MRMGYCFTAMERFATLQATLATMKLVAKVGIRFAAALTLLRE